VRITATAAWAARDPEGARQAAVELLSTMTDVDDPTLVLSAFVDHRDGPQNLAAALEGSELAAFVAATGVRLADESGRDLSALMDAFIRAGSLKPLAEKPNPAELAQLVRDVDRLGDPHRGEAVYRRAESACSKCHAIGGVGGRVGPDLASLGGSAQLGHLFESLFDPSAKIKQGFQTQSVLTDDGKVMSGRVERQTAGAVLLRDAQNNVINIPEGSVEEIVSSQTSLMPTGLPRTMRRDELVDLVRFLSMLGKDESFRVPTRPVMQQWDVLQPSAELVEQLKSTPTFDALVDTDTVNWKRVYSTVSGGLPLADIPALETAAGRVGFVRFIVRATQPGPAELRIDDTGGLSLWAGGSAVAVRENTQIEVGDGPLALLVRINLSKRQTPLSIEVSSAD
jgi:putative heme-binding domain-containing protein